MRGWLLLLCALSYASSALAQRSQRKVDDVGCPLDKNAVQPPGCGGATSNANGQCPAGSVPAGRNQKGVLQCRPVGTSSSTSSAAQSGKSHFKEIPGGTYYDTTDSGAGDPCDVREYVARLQQLKDDDSAAALAQLQNIGSQMMARLQHCQDSASEGDRDSSGAKSSGGNRDHREAIATPPPPKLIDPDSFAAAGGEENPVDKSVQDILDSDGALKDDQDAVQKARSDSADDQKTKDCQALLKYRDSQLRHEFEVAMTQRDIYITQREEEFTLAKDTLNLINDDWWLGKLSGGHGEVIAEIATKVKFVTDEVNAFLSFFPAEDLGSKGAKYLTKTNFDTVAGGAAPTVDILKSWTENGAQKAAEDGGRAAAWRLAEELSPLVAVQEGLLDYHENVEGLENFREITQRQVAQIVQTARNWQDKAAEAQSKADAINQISQQISAFCSPSLPPQQQGIPIGRPGDPGVPIRKQD